LAFLAPGRRDPRTGEHEHDPDAWELLDGLRRAGLPHGIRIENEWLVTAPTTGEPMRQAIDAFLSLRRRPSAALCFDGDVALPMLETMRNASIDCPGNLSVITRGPSSDQRIAANRLAYLRNDPELMGQLAVRVLVERIRGHRRDAVRLAVASRWISGDSVAPPRSARIVTHCARRPT
jgi:DNA-binding LacI/PurR family transcriptional regulator